MPFLWLVDLEARVLTAHRLDGETLRVIGEYNDETEARIAPFDAVPLNIADWWPPTPPANSPVTIEAVQRSSHPARLNQAGPLSILLRV